MWTPCNCAKIFKLFSILRKTRFFLSSFVELHAPLVLGIYFYFSKILELGPFMKNDQKKIPHPLINDKYGFEKHVFGPMEEGQPILPLWIFVVFPSWSTLIFNMVGLVNVCAKFHAFITICTIMKTRTLTREKS